jgi:hypothetical protein
MRGLARGSLGPDMQEDSYAGLRDLVKKSIPLVSQVGAVTGGLVSLLAALEKVSGELTMALAGFMLVAAMVSSGIVIWGRTTRGAGKAVVSVPLFSRAHRRTAGIALVVSIVLLILFLVQVGVALSRPSGQGRFAINPSMPGGNARAVRPTPTPTTVTPLAGPSSTPALSPTETRTALPAAPSPVVGAAALVTQGFAALSEQDYARALSLFDRALQTDATSGRAQLGLGEAYYYLADYRAAIPPLRLALQLDPDLNEAHAFLGFAYDDSQDSVRARAEYGEFLRVAPIDSPLRSQVEERFSRHLSPSPAASPGMRSTVPPSRTPAGP